MALTVDMTTSTGHPDTWTDFYKKNGADKGPFQTLFETNSAAMARVTRSHLNKTGSLTETITGSDHGNMVLVPGGAGIMQLIHHGFACNTTAGFTLAFAHGNLAESTTFKTVDRDEMVAPALARQEAGGEGTGTNTTTFTPSLESMMGAESPTEFRDLEPEDNTILERYPNHCLINTNIFAEVEGAKQISSKDLAFTLVEAFQLSVVDDDEISVEREAEAVGLENILATLWASENGLLKEIRLDDVPESAMMSHLIRGVKQKLAGRTATGPGREGSTGVAGHPSREGATNEDRAGAASMEMMAASSQSMVALLSRFQEGNDADRQRKEAEKSILKTMGPTQRDLFTALCTRRMNEAPSMSAFMINLTTSKTPQKAINLIQSETRDWEGTFSVGGFHKMLSHGFLSQDPNLANPGGFTIFMFHPKTVSLGEKGGRGGNELLREYLGMEVDESTLDFYMKQGFYTPSSPNDLRIQLQTALDTLELLTCDGSIAGKGLAFILEPRRWARMSTVLNDRFKSEKEFGAKFCYTLDRHLQTFFNKVTRWEDMATDGQPRYLVAKAEELLERLEDGQGLNIVLPVALSTAASTGAPDGKKRSGASPTAEKAGKKKKATGGESLPAGTTEATDPSAVHANEEVVDDWKLPPGTRYLELFDAKMPGLKGWPVLLDTRITKKQNRSQKAPMCVRFQALGQCKQGCSLAHITAGRMTAEARSKADSLFKAVYTS